MRRIITSLPALACFRAAAETESFSAAAARLHLTHGAISRAVRLVEDDLGVALFHRQPRGVALTEEGWRLARAVAEGLDRIDSVARDIRDRHARARAAGPVTVSCEPTLLLRWLIPRMGGFQAAHPGCEVRLLAGGGPVGFGDGIDLAIRRDDYAGGEADWTLPLFAEAVGPVCRPDCAAAWLAGGRIAPGTVLLHSRTRPSAWRDWAAAGRESGTGETEDLAEGRDACAECLPRAGSVAEGTQADGAAAQRADADAMNVAGRRNPPGDGVTLAGSGDASVGSADSDAAWPKAAGRATCAPAEADPADDLTARHPAQVFEHFYLSLQAAVAGLGVAAAPWALVQDDLAAGLLVAPLGFRADGSRYLLRGPAAPVPDSAAARFAAWLAETAAEAAAAAGV